MSLNNLFAQTGTVQDLFRHRTPSLWTLLYRDDLVFNEAACRNGAQTIVALNKGSTSQGISYTNASLAKGKLVAKQESRVSISSQVESLFGQL